MSTLARSAALPLCIGILVTVCVGCLHQASQPPSPMRPVATEAGSQGPGAEIGPWLRLAAGLNPAEVIPGRGDFAVGHGWYVRSPDRTKKIVEAHLSARQGAPSDIQFWLVDLTGKEHPRMLCSVQQNFDPGAEVALGEYRVVWSGDSQGVYVDVTPEDCPHSVADLQGNGRKVEGEIFRSRGWIVGSLPGTTWVLVQTLDAGDIPCLTVVDPEGRALRTFREKGKAVWFEDADYGGRFLYVTRGANEGGRIFLADALKGGTKVIGVGSCPRFRPQHGTITYYTRPSHDAGLLLEYDPVTSRTQQLLVTPGMGDVDCEWSANGKVLFVKGDTSNSVYVATFP